MKQAITAIETSIENAIQARLALAPNPSGFMAAICETWAQRQERFAEGRQEALDKATPSVVCPDSQFVPSGAAVFEGLDEDEIEGAICHYEWKARYLAQQDQFQDAADAHDQVVRGQAALAALRAKQAEPSPCQETLDTPTYRLLAAGETIATGDEFLNHGVDYGAAIGPVGYDDPVPTYWAPTKAVGQTVAPHMVGDYRRPVAGTPQPDLLPLAPVAATTTTTTTTPERAALATFLWANRRRIDYVDKEYREGKLYQRIYWAMMPDEDGNLADDSIACTSPRHSCQAGPLDKPTSGSPYELANTPQALCPKPYPPVDCCELCIYDNEGHEGMFIRLRAERSAELIKVVHQHLLRHGPASLDDCNFELTNHWGAKPTPTAEPEPTPKAPLPDPGYRMLAAGETIAEGDEQLNVDDEWVPAAMCGRVPTRYVGCYRRPVCQETLDKTYRLLQAGETIAEGDELNFGGGSEWLATCADPHPVTPTEVGHVRRPLLAGVAGVPQPTGVLPPY